MADSDKGFSSSNTLRSPLVSKSSPSGLGENDENDVSQDQMISKFLIPNKPAGKHPRRKVLAERNRKTPDLEMKNISKKSNVVNSDISSTNCASVSNDDDGVVGDSSLKPYDPFKNYLVPRPKYLRYDPNKRHTVFQGSESREILSDDGEEEDVEEENEEFEEKGWCISGVLRFLLLIMFIYFLSTSSPIQQAILGFKDDYPIIQKQICEAVYMEVYGGGFLEREDRDSGFEVHNIQVVEDNYLDTVDTSEAAEMVEEDDNVQLVEVDNVERVESSERDLVEDDAFDIDSIMESVKYEFDSEVIKEMPLAVAVIAESKDNEGGGLDHIDNEGGGLDHIEEAKIVQSDDGGYELNTEGASGPDMELLELHEISNNLVEEIEEEFYYSGETDKVGPHILHALGVSTMFVVLASLAFVCRSKKVQTSPVKDYQPSIEPFTPKVEDESTKVGPALDAEHIAKEIESSPRPPLSLSSSKAEEYMAKEIETSIRSPLSLSCSIAEATEEIGSYIHAPTVQLLGEIVIREVGGGSNSKIPAIGFEESSSNASQKGSKSRPVSVPSQPSKPEETVPSQPSKPEISTKNSSSYRSITDERKISKKEGGKDGELKVEFTTPVRRSSRIRTRSVVSP